MEPVPSELRIGFVFKRFSSEGGQFTADARGLQILAAFLMAVREVNDKADGIADDLLPSSRLVFAAHDTRGIYNSALRAAVALTQTSFGGRGVLGVVGPGIPDTTLATQLVLGAADVLHVGFSSANELLSTRHDKTYVSTRANDAFDGDALALLLSDAWLRLSRVVVLHSSDDFGNYCFKSFANKAIALDSVKIAAKFSFPTRATDFSDIISEVSVYRPRVIVLFAGSSISAARLLEQGFESGLIAPGVTVLGNSLVSSAATTDLFVNKSNTAAIMKGFLGLASYEDYWKETAVGKSFIDRFVAQPTRASIDPATGATVCDESTDDDGALHLYSEHAMYNSSMPVVCAFVNFSSIRSDGSNMDSVLPFVYDAAHALARGLHSRYYSETAGNQSLSGSELKQRMTSSVRFEGASGLVSFTPSYYGGAGGDRHSAVKYKVVNFQTASSSFGYVGYLDMDTAHFTACAPSSSCFTPEFNTVGNVWPADAPPPIVFVLAAATRAVLYSLAALVFAATVSVCFFNYRYKQNRRIKDSQNSVSCVFLLGSLAGGVRVLVGTADVTPFVCACESVTGHFAFFACILSIAAKKLRIHLVVSSEGAELVSSREADWLKRLAAFLVVLVVYFAIEVGFGNFVVKDDVVEDIAGQKSVFPHCAYELIEFEYILFVIEGVVLVVALRVCWLTREVPDFLNDSHRSTAVVALAAVVGIVSVTETLFAIALRPREARLLSAVAFAVCLIWALAILFGLPIRSLRNDIRAVATVPSSSKVDYDNIKLVAPQALKDSKPEDFYRICVEQEAQWKKKRGEVAALSSFSSAGRDLRKRNSGAENFQRVNF